MPWKDVQRRIKLLGRSPLPGETGLFWTEKLHQAQATLAQRDADPLRQPVEKIVGSVGDYVSTAALLQLLHVPNTTGNCRRIAVTMRSLGFIPIKSRRLMPGGYRDTVTRGWARPVRQTGCRNGPKHIVTVERSHSLTSMNERTQGKDCCYVL
jgi:hypothetical protein